MPKREKHTAKQIVRFVGIKTAKEKRTKRENYAGSRLLIFKKNNLFYKFKKKHSYGNIKRRHRETNEQIAALPVTTHRPAATIWI
jgi:hypothetical protein